MHYVSIILEFFNNRFCQRLLLCITIAFGSRHEGRANKRLFRRRRIDWIARQTIGYCECEGSLDIDAEDCITLGTLKVIKTFPINRFIRSDPYCFLLSCPVLSSSVWSSFAVCSSVLSSSVLSFSSRHLLSCSLLSCHLPSCPLLSRPLLSCPRLSCPLLSLFLLTPLSPLLRSFILNFIHSSVSLSAHGYTLSIGLIIH